MKTTEMTKAEIFNRVKTIISDDIDHYGEHEVTVDTNLAHDLRYHDLDYAVLVDNVEDIFEIVVHPFTIGELVDLIANQLRGKKNENGN